MHGWRKHPHNTNLPVVGTTEIQLLPAVANTTLETGKGGPVKAQQASAYATDKKSKGPLKPRI